MPSLEISEKQGIRYLHFGSELIQGAMRIARPWALELEYTRELMFPLLLRGDAWPRDVLQVGLGAASTTKFLYRHRPGARLTVVELREDVVAAARAWFKLPEDPRRLRIEIGDGHDYVTGTQRAFDFIVLDGFDAEGRAGMLDQTPFYLACRQRLRTGGLLAANFIDRGRGVRASLERLQAAFDRQVLVLPRHGGGNTIAVASPAEFALPTLGILAPAARRLKAETRLDLSPTLARLM